MATAAASIPIVTSAKEAFARYEAFKSEGRLVQESWAFDR